MSGNDRFRIITFNDTARDFIQDYTQATPENTRRMLNKIQTIETGGGTNVYAGIESGKLKKLGYVLFGHIFSLLFCYLHYEKLKNSGICGLSGIGHGLMVIWWL